MRALVALQLITALALADVLTPPTIHLLVNCQPRYAHSYLANYFKGKSARQILSSEGDTAHTTSFTTSEGAVFKTARR